VLRFSVRPGDHLSASDSASGPLEDHFTLKLTDIRYRKNQSPLRWTKTVHLNASAQPVGEIDGIVAGVAAPPSPTDGPNLLADFGSVHFTGVTLNDQVLGSFEPNIDQVDLTSNVDGYTHILAATGSLGSTGDSFHVTWHRGS
jgi:hypothetical protein